MGTPYSQTIALSGGTPPFQWSVYNGPILTGFKVGGAVPDGLTLDANTGKISGTPTGGGTWYFEATVTDATGATAIDGFLNIQVSSSARSGNPVPFLNQPLVPTAVPPGSPAFTLSVSGTGFLPGSTINFNRAPLATTFIDNGHLAALVPAADVANAGTTAVTVVNSGPGGGPSNVVYFQVAAADTTLNFAAARNIPLQNQIPAGITVGDFNGDGKPDLAIAASIWVDVLLGKGDGTFAPAPGSPISVASPPYNDEATPFNGPIVPGDFTHSGNLGLAVVDEPNAAAYILLGKGDGTFGAPATFSVGNTPIAMLAADFNNDGKLDLAVANYGDGTVTLLLGTGDGTFTQPSGSPYAVGRGQTTSSIAAADFNGDGKLDIAVANLDGTVSILLQQ